MSSNKVAVIGYGYWGKNHARVLDELGVLSGVFDLEVSKDKNASYNFFSSIDEVIHSSNAAVIATPATTHYSIANKLISELDLLIEKPMSMSTSECDDLLTKSKKSEKLIMVGHQLHFHPAILKIKDFVNNDVLGNIKWIYSNRLNMGKIRSEENVLWSFAPHDISLILDFVKSEVNEINIQGTNIINNGIEDTTLTTLTFENGVRGHIFVSWFHPFKEQRFVLVGEKGTFVFTDSSEKNKLVLYQTKFDSDSLTINEHESQNIEFETSEPLKNQAKYFIDCINSRNCDINSGLHGKKVVEVLEKSTQLLKNSN